jgi:hypothetical protein
MCASRRQRWIFIASLSVAWCGDEEPKEALNGSYEAVLTSIQVIPIGFVRGMYRITGQNISHGVTD